MGFWDDVVDFASDPVNIATGGLSGGIGLAADSLTPDINVPGPTPQEQELTGLQLESARQAREDAALTRPLLLQALGYKEVDGKLVPLTDAERAALRTPEQQAALDIQRQIQERQKRALAGELEVPTFIQQELDRGQQELDLIKARQGIGTGTIQKQEAFNRTRLGLLDQIRRGEISANEAYLTSRFGLLPNQQLQQAGSTGLLSGRQLGLISGFSPAFQPHQFQRGLQFNANLQNAANRAQLISDLFGAGGTAAGFLALA